MGDWGCYTVEVPGFGGFEVWDGIAVCTVGGLG